MKTKNKFKKELTKLEIENQMQRWEDLRLQGRITSQEYILETKLLRGKLDKLK
jgi:hypothetical protein